MNRIMHRSMSRAAHMRGLSLIELMIAMTLGMATIAAVGWIYLGAVQTYRSQDAIARLQESARYAFELVANDLRMTGTAGCSYATNVKVLNTTQWYGDLFTQPLASIEETGVASTVTEFSDALRVLHADVSREYIVQSHAAPQFTLTTSHDLATGDLMLATNCDHAALFQASGASGATVNHGTTGTPGNSVSALGAGAVAYTYGAGSRLYKVSAATYYVANNPAGVPSLFRERPTGASATLTAEELIEGVEDFQVTYGVDSDVAADGQANSPYLTADEVNAGAWGANAQERWARVLSVRISFLMRTVENNVVASEQTYTYNGANVTATDRRLRKAFTHVVKLRNR
jgi:type IV pilus assembly protein PilW